MPPEYWILIERDEELIHQLSQYDRLILYFHDNPEELKKAEQRRERILWALDVVAACIRMYLDDASLSRNPTVAISGNIAWIRG